MDVVCPGRQAARTRRFSENAVWLSAAGLPGSSFTRPLLTPW